MRYGIGGLGQKAPQGTSINWGLALAKDIKIYLPMTEGAGGKIWNLANNRPFTFQDVSPAIQTSYFWGEDTAGTYTWNNSASDAICYAYYDIAGTRYDTNNGITFGAYAIFDAVTGNYCSLMGRRLANDANVYDWQIAAGAGGNWQIFCKVATSGAVSPTTPSLGSKPQLIIVTHDNVNIRIYTNGNLVSTTTATGAMNNLGDWVHVSNHPAAFGSPVRYQKPIYAVYMWNRCLGENEIKQLWQDPYCLSYQRKKIGTSGFTAVPLSLSSSDSLNLLSDSAINSGYQYQALSRSDTMQLLDAIAIFGGAPDFQLALSDNLLHLQDQLTPLVPAILKTLSDSLNNLSDSASKTFGIPKQAFDDLNNWAEAITTVFAGVLTEVPADSLNNWLDLVSKTVGNVPFFVTAADTLNNLNDALRIWNVLRKASADNMVLSDSLEAKFNHLLKTAEVLSNFLEHVGLDLRSIPSFADSMTLSDATSIALGVQHSRTASDSLLMTDSVVVTATGTYIQPGFLSRIKRYLNEPQ